MTINKAQGQSIPGTLGTDLYSQCFSHGQLYVALSRTTDPRNVFILTIDGSNKASNVVNSEVFDMRNNIPIFHKSGVTKQLTQQQRQKNRVSIMNLINPESGLGTEIRSPCDASNAETLDEDVISIADDYETVSDGDIFQNSTIENPSISEFESVYGLIPERISCGSITFNKHDIETIITPNNAPIMGY